MWAKQVLWFRVFTETVPECTTFEFIGKPSRAEILALYMLIIGSAVRRNSWSIFTILVAIIAHWSSTAFSFETMPKTSTVVLIWEISSSISICQTVNDLVIWSTIWFFSGGCYIWGTVVFILTWTVSTINIMGKGTPRVTNVIFEILRTFFMRYTSIITHVVLPTAFRIW